VKAAALSGFRGPLLIAGAFVALSLALFGYLYLQAAASMTARFDPVLTGELDALATDEPARRLTALDDRLRDDPRRVKLEGLFAPDGARVAGNVLALPPDLPRDGQVHDATLTRIDGRGQEIQKVRAVAETLPDGVVAVVARNIDEIADIAAIVRRVLALGVLPTLGLAVIGGVLLSLRTRRRIAEITRTAQRIVAGDLRERLTLRRGDEDFNSLARVVNTMLDEIERLIHEIAGIGDDIAHELRTPLTRTRAILERGRANAQTLEALQDVADRAIGGLDRTLAIVTALLRIAEIEHRHRLAGFGDVELAGIVREVAELYQPMAEDREIALTLDAPADSPGGAPGGATVRGDRDLLFEAVANLVDNALKFTPSGGRIDLALRVRAGDTVVRVADTGPGIPEAERDAVTRRFYRADKSRRTPGVGLGLALVAAIAKLHGFRLSIGGGPGCVVELVCPRPAAA